MSKLRPTVFLWFLATLFFCFLIPLFFDIVQPKPALSQSYYEGDINKYSYSSSFPSVMVDSRFSADERNRLAPAFFLLSALTQEKNNYGYQGQYFSCITKYHDFPWKHMSFEERGHYLQDRDGRGELIDGNIIPKLRKAFSKQVNGRRRRLYIEFYKKLPDEGSRLITQAYAYVGEADKNDDLHIYVNQAWLATRLPSVNPRWWFEIGGTLLHESLHLIGYTHPVVKEDFSNVQNNIAYESGWCMKREMADKPPGSPNLTDDSDLFVD